MTTSKTNIHGIPAIIWGKKADKVYIHVHGKMSCKEFAGEFARIAEEKGYQTISFDLPEHGERKQEDRRCDIWNGIHDLNAVGEYAFSNWEEVSLFACSLGAYFSLNAYPGRNLKKCLFQSPILNMEYLIRQMMNWFQISEEQLFCKKEIETPIDRLSWEYYQYVKAHPVTAWPFPTSILYAGKDNLQSLEVVRNFSDTFGCDLTIAQNSGHAFMAEGDGDLVIQWLSDQV